MARAGEVPGTRGGEFTGDQCKAEGTSVKRRPEAIQNPNKPNLSGGLPGPRHAPPCQITITKQGITPTCLL